MKIEDLSIFYMKKNIDAVHNIYKDALEELESNMQAQLRNLR